MNLLSIIVPIYNEAPIIETFHKRLIAAVDTMECQLEIIYVNDGSHDNSLVLLNTLQDQYPCVALVDLSRNFGKEIALSAGIDHAQGDAMVVIDADLQDPPELIPTLYQRWQEGYDVVYAKRSSRQGESILKKTSAYLFYRFISKISSVSIPTDTGDFRLISRRVADSLKQLRETHRFMKGLFAWVGYPQTSVIFEREPRVGGTTKWNYWKLWNLAIEGITSFSIAPLKIATYLGFLTSLGAFLYALVIIYKTLMFGESVRGYPSLMVAILFLGGIQLVTLGIIGEYLGRTFVETKRRPLYLLNCYSPSNTK